MSQDKTTEHDAQTLSEANAEALNQHAQVLAQSVETLRGELLQSDQRIESLEQRARELASFVEEARQQILSHSDSQISVLEEKARHLAEYADSLRSELKPQSELEIAALGKRASELARFVDNVRTETRTQFDAGIGAMGQKAQDLAVHVEAVREKSIQSSASAAAKVGQTQRELSEAAERLNARLLREISERKQAEAALRSSEERYRTLFNSIDEAFCIVEVSFDQTQQATDYRFLEVNPTFAKQTGLLEASGKRIRDLDPQHEMQWLEICGRVAASGETHRFIQEGKLPGERSFDVYACRVGGDSSRKVAIVFNDISERREFERKLKEQADVLVDLHRRKDEFLAMLSHELRSPLAPISNALQLLRMQKHEHPQQRHASEIIERQMGQLKHLIDDLLEVSRITSGRVQLRTERTSLGGIVKRAIETANPLMQSRGHSLLCSLPSEAVCVQADPARLEQVVVNLLTNAGKYTDDGGQIWVTVTQEGLIAVLQVRDTGVGIAAELLPHIFDLFTQADRSLDRSQGGLGIGLCLVKRLVELHGGSVEVSSALGKGSEFTVRLPVSEAAAATETPALVEVATVKNCKVLVVDDNLDGAESLSQLLKLFGHEVVIAHDGLSALELAAQVQPDVVLLDIGLPGLSGWEVAVRMRALPLLKDVVLVALTGYGQETDRARSAQAGFNHHLVKPADFDTVQNILASLAA